MFRTIDLMASVCALLLLVVTTLASELPDNVVGVHEVRGFNRREHTLSKPFQTAGMSIPYWNIVGSTMITSMFIRLTSDVKSMQGAVWNVMPVKSRDWEVAINFKVSGSLGDLFGDGFAFWYVKEPGFTGPVFGSKDYFSGLAVFFDTYNNWNGPHSHGHPYVSAMVSNGSVSYDHDKDGTHTELAGCTSKFRNKNHDTNALIRYADDTVSVYMDVEDKGLWKKCFSVPGVRLPTNYFFGLSAATGDLSDAHDIIWFKMYELDILRAEKQDEADRENLSPNAQIFAAPRDHVPDAPPPKLSWLKTVFLICVAVIGVGVCLFVGVSIFQKRQEQSRKRFY